MDEVVDDFINADWWYAFTEVHHFAFWGGSHMLTSNPKRRPETPMITSLPDIWRPVHLVSLEAKLFLLSSQQIIDLIPSCSHLSSLLLLLFISKHGVQPTPSWTRQRLCLSLTRQADLAAITPAYATTLDSFWEERKISRRLLFLIGGVLCLEITKMPKFYLIIDEDNIIFFLYSFNA